MIPTNRDRLAPHITGRDRFMDGRRHSQRSGLLGTTALYPSIPAMRYYKGGGGIGGIIGSIVMGAVLGALTGGLGVAFGLTEGTAFMGLEAGYMSGIARGAAMGALGGALTGVAGAVLGQKTSAVSEAQYEARDNKVNVRTSVPPRKRILGTALAGGALIYAATTGSSNSNLHMVFPVASHKVAAMREAYFNNIPESNSRFSSYYRLNRHLGAQDQTADSDLVSECSEWTTAHRLRGTAYLYERLTYNQNAWVSGIPTTSVVTDGALLYDPRKPHLTLSASVVGSPGVFSTVGAHGFAAGDIVFIRDHAGATYASATGLTVPVEKHYTVGSVPSSSQFTLLNEGGEPMPLLSAGAGGSVCKCGWSNNAQLGVYDYLLSRDGFNCGLDEVHWSTVESGADICDEDVVLGTSETFTVSTTSNVLTLSDLVPWATGTQVYVSSSDTLPAPLSGSTAYYWIAGEDSEDASMGQLAASYTEAVGYDSTNDSEDVSANQAIDITDTGSGTHTITVAVSATTSADNDTVTLSDTKTYIETGDKVAVIDEASLLHGQDLYWRNTGYLQGKLYASRADAMDGTAIDITVSETVRLTRVAQARYTINGVLDLSKKPIDILNDLLTACGGVAVYTQGQYRVYPAAPAVSVGTISQNDLRGNIGITPKPARQELVNAVRGTYKSPSAYWEMTDFPPITSAAYEEEDGGSRLYKDIALPLTIDGQRAQRIATIALKRARKGTVNFPTTLRKLGVSAWDCLDLNLDIAGIAGKKYRVTYWAVQENAGGIDLTLRDESDDIYEWHPKMASMAVNRDLSSLPTPWVVSPPTNLTLTSGTDDLLVQGDGSIVSRIRATWTDPADASLVRIDVRAKPSASTTWQQFTPVLPGVQKTYISPVTDGEPWDVETRAVNSMGAKSDEDDAAEWQAGVHSHMVIGKSAPPSDPANLYVTSDAVVWQQPVRDKDLAGWRIRQIAGKSRNWSQGADYPADGSIITSPSVPVSAFGSGVRTIMVRSVDTTGNLSAGTLYLTLGLGEASPSNLILTYDEKAAGFPGTITGGSVDGDGNLVSDTSGDLLLPDNNALLLPIVNDLLLPGAWGQMVYDFTYTPAYADAPGTLLLDSNVFGDGWQTLYKRRGTTGLLLQNDDEALLPDEGALFLDGPQPFAVWPGALDYRKREKIDFRIVTEAGSRRGIISALAIKIDVPDVTESFQDLAIAAGGTRLPLTNTYRVIDYIGTVTVQDTGTGAAYPVVIDKNPTLGPLIEVRNSSGASVAAVIDIQDLKGH